MSEYTDFNDSAKTAIESLQETLNCLLRIQQFSSPDIYNLCLATDLLLSAWNATSKAKELVYRIAIKIEAVCENGKSAEH